MKKQKSKQLEVLLLSNDDIYSIQENDSSSDSPKERVNKVYKPSLKYRIKKYVKDSNLYQWFSKKKLNFIIEFNKIKYLLRIIKYGVVNYGTYSDFVMDEFVDYLTIKNLKNKKTIDAIVDEPTSYVSSSSRKSDVESVSTKYRQNVFVKIKKLTEDAVVPSYANDGDACFDLVATSVEVTDSYIEYGTGLAMELQFGTVGLIYPRSSISKTDLVLANGTGVIDSGYRGEIKFRFKNVSKGKKQDSGVVYKVGDRVGQMMILPLPNAHFELTDELNDSKRGQGGFGSSGQ